MIYKTIPLTAGPHFCRTAIALAALFLSAPAEARAEDPTMEAVRKSAGKMRRIVEAIHKYREAHGNKLPGPAILDAEGKSVLSWRVDLLPYLGEDALYKQFRRNEPWDSPHNKALLAKMPNVYAAVEGVKVEPGHTFYQAFVGKGTSFEPGETLDIPDFTDGTVNTIAFVEATKTVPWTKPTDLTYSKERPLPRLGGQFDDDITVAFVSGDVRFLDKKEVDEATLRALISRDGGEPVSTQKVTREIPPLR